MRTLLCIGAIVMTGCLSAPGRPTSNDDAGNTDAAVTDAPFAIDAADDAASDARINDASVPGPGVDFPPAATAVNITAGWSGDINGDGFDDLLLASNTGADATTGVYVLFGQAGQRLTKYHKFIQTGPQRAQAVMATDLDGAGNLDIVAYVVDFKTATVGDEQACLMAYLANGSDFDAPVANDISAVSSTSWAAPFDENRPLAIFTARLDPAKQPSIVVVHNRGGLTLTLPSWSAPAWQSTNALELFQATGSTGGAALTNVSNSSVDDIIVWNDGNGDMTWHVNNGSGTLTPTTVNGVIRGPTYATLYDMDGMPPLDVVRVTLSDLTAVPVDTNMDTTGGRYNGQGFINGLGTATSLLVFDSDSSDPRPEILFTPASCDMAGGDPCVFMVRNAYLDETSGDLITDDGERHLALPTGFQARLMLRGDYDGDDNPEVVIINSDGSHACTRVAEGLFSSCD